MMWKQPWGYIEGWTICGGLFITGLILQLSVGKVATGLLSFPFNLIFGVLFLLLLALFHLISRKNERLQWFAGYTATITVLTALLLLVVIMGFTRQAPPSLEFSSGSGFARIGFMQMTASWPFVLLYLYFLWVLGLVILRRISRFTWKDVGFVLNHTGLFIALFAAALGDNDLQRLRMTVPVNTSEWRASNEKNEKIELPLAIELKSFTIDEYPPKLMLLDNATGEALPKKQPQNVLVETCPLSAELADWKLEITDYLPSAAALINRDTVNFTAFHQEGATSALYVKAQNRTDGTKKEGWVSCGSYLFPYASLRLNEKESLIMPNREPKHFTSDVTVYTQNGSTQEALIEVNKPLSVEGWKIYQLSYDEAMGKWSRTSVFELVKDPWLPAVYTGIGMMVVGALFLFMSAPKKRI